MDVVLMHGKNAILTPNKNFRKDSFYFKVYFNETLSIPNLTYSYEEYCWYTN